MIQHSDREYPPVEFEAAYFDEVEAPAEVAGLTEAGLGETLVGSVSNMKSFRARA